MTVRTHERSGESRRIAVVTFNLGGPDAPETVEPFLFNLFNDSAIVGLPQPLRWGLATLIAHRRAPVAREIYARIGGKSPLLEETRRQARALEAALADVGEVRVVIAMRYWHPMSDEAALEVEAFAPDEVVLLPLYPQFSTATSASSLAVWHRAARKAGLKVPTRAVCCYPTALGFVTAHANLIRPALEEAAATSRRPRLLFSAHGLPKRTVAKGDPYVWQVEQTAGAVTEVLERAGAPAFEARVSYQSRVGPLEWVGPSTEAEILQAGRDGVPLVVSPIAFVSEHSETLVELDIEYRALADAHGVPAFVRVPALGAEEGFIEALAGMVRRALGESRGICSEAGGRLCPPSFARCAQPVPGA